LLLLKDQKIRPKKTKKKDQKKRQIAFNGLSRYNWISNTYNKFSILKTVLKSILMLYLIS